MSRRRSRARERKEAREKQQQRNRQLAIIGVVVVVAIVGAILFFTSNQPAEAPIPEDAVARYEEFITGTNDLGFPRLGNPDAPVEVVEFSDFGCPNCYNFHRSAFPELLPRVERGEISFVYVPLAVTGNNAEGAARTALCAQEQDTFWSMHDTLFEWHSLFGTTAFRTNRILAGVESLGMDTGEFNACFNSQTTSDLITTAATQGVGATPTIRVNGTTVDANLAAINTAIDSRLELVDLEDIEPGTIEANEDDAEATEEATNEATEETTPEATDASMEATEEMTEEATPEATEETTDDADSTGGEDETDDDTDNGDE